MALVILLLAYAATGLARLLPAAGGVEVLAATAMQQAPGMVSAAEAAERAAAVPAPVAGTSRAEGREIVVGPAEAVTTIRAALAAAQDGDHLRILPGTYAEGTIEVDRTVTITGVGWPVLDAEGRGSVLRITADDVAVRGLVLRNAGVSHVADHAALLFEGVTGCTAEDNRLEDNFFGIYLARSRGCVVRGNVITASGTREVNAGNGVHMWNADSVLVVSNTIHGHRDGIYLEHVRGAVLRGNTSERNLRYGLHFMFSSGASYEDNVFRNNGAGVAVMYSKNVRMLRNTFADNWGTAAYGLLVKEITDSEVTGNRFERNTVALSSDGSLRVEVRGNRFIRNGWGVRVLSNSRDNAFIGNDFIDNTFDVTTNSRRNSNHFSGNYWSRYDGYDLTGDGYGDVAHRPVRLFSIVVEHTPVALVLLRGLFIDLLDVAERVMPVLTPETLIDDKPRMREVAL
jgi:nitrous oxidase accessory protein